MDDRPLDDMPSALAVLRAEIEDLKSTNAARIAAAVAEARRRPVGSTDLVFRGTPEPGTLFLQGQTLQRADYPALWAWAQASGSVVVGGYGAGNGSTTFTLPDTRGRVPMGAGTLGSDSYALGATPGVARHTLASGEMPAHGHTGSAASAGSHIHDTTNGFMDQQGGHAGHFPGSQFNAAAGSDLGLAAWNSGGGTRGDHGHFFSLDITSGGTHAHTVTIDNTGGGGPHENRQPSLAMNFAVWT